MVTISSGSFLIHYDFQNGKRKDSPMLSKRLKIIRRNEGEEKNRFDHTESINDNERVPERGYQECSN